MLLFRFEERKSDPSEAQRTLLLPEHRKRREGNSLCCEGISVLKPPLLRPEDPSGWVSQHPLQTPATIEDGN